MTLKYLGGTLPTLGAYEISLGSLTRLPRGKWELSIDTVESVQLQATGKEYNYAKGAVGGFAGAAVAGPLGLVVGAALPALGKDDVVQFVITFRNGDVAHFAGSPRAYQSALNSSYKKSLNTRIDTAGNALLDRMNAYADRKNAERAAKKARKIA